MRTNTVAHTKTRLYVPYVRHGAIGTMAFYCVVYSQSICVYLVFLHVGIAKWKNKRRTIKPRKIAIPLALCVSGFVGVIFDSLLIQKCDRNKCDMSLTK